MVHFVLKYVSKNVLNEGMDCMYEVVFILSEFLCSSDVETSVILELRFLRLFYYEDYFNKLMIGKYHF